MDKTIQVALAKLEDEVGKVVRRQDELQKSLDLLFADRQILEGLQGSMKHLQEIILSNQQHQDMATKDLKNEVKETQAIVDNSVQEVKDKITDKSIIITTKNQNIFQKVIQKLENKL